MWTSIVLFLLSPLLKWLTLYTIIALIGFALFLFTPAWFPVRFRMVALIVAVGAVLCGAHARYFFGAGEDHMAQRIAAKDAAAVARVDTAKTKVDACNGGVSWNVTTGTCDSP